MNKKSLCRRSIVIFVPLVVASLLFAGCASNRQRVSRFQNTPAEDARMNCEILLGEPERTETNIKKGIGRTGMNVGGGMAPVLLIENPPAGVVALVVAFVGTITLTDASIEESLRHREIGRCIQEQLVKNQDVYGNNIARY